MAHEQNQDRARIDALERQIQSLKLCLAVGACVTVAVALAAAPRAQQVPDSLRVRQLIVEDSDGRARIRLGYLDAPGNTNRMGIRIDDARGVERMGLSLRADGGMVMGFDAPPGTGDDRNRERVTIVADEKGGAHIRFLDRRTSVASRMYLDDQNQVWLSFSDFTTTPPRTRRYGLAGEETTPR